MKTVLFTILSVVLGLSNTMAQCLTTDFSVAPNACFGQNLILDNLSDPGNYQWDFCTGDFNTTPSAQNLYEIPRTDGRPGLEFAKDGNVWFAFSTGTSSNALFRLRFDNGLRAAPTVTEDLGNLNGMLHNPGQIRIIREGVNWFGLVHNTSTGDLLKMSFGNSLNNSFTTSVLYSGLGYSNSGLAVGKDGAEGWVCVLSLSGGNFALIRLGNSVNAPSPSDILYTTPFSTPTGFADVDLIHHCGNWIAYAAANLGGSNIYRLTFGSNLFSDPTVNLVASVTPTNLGRVRMARDGEEYFLLVTSFEGLLQKLEFGSDPMSVPAVVNEGSLNGTIPGNLFGLAVAREASTWTVITISQGTGKAYHINYDSPCSAAFPTSGQSEPQISYGSAGVYQITLENAAGLGTGYKTRSVTVSSLTPPDINFSKQNMCAGSAVDFTSFNASGSIIGFAWDLGDGNSSSNPNPSHVYSTAAKYEVQLTVTSSNSCSNSTVQSIDIFNPPVADFALPAVTPICTNQSYTLSNTSTFNPASNPTWEWRLNGTLVPTQQHLNTAFTAAPQSISLKALIQGCENETTKNIATVLSGPAVDFLASDDCAESLVSFTNTTTGTVSGYAWSFGDGSPGSALPQPVHSYTSAGAFQVSLTASNLAGCQNQAVKSVTIYSLPQPDFSVGLPPFSCSNTPTPFQNNTPPLTDSNISDWAWSFGDAAGSSSINQSPSFTYTAGGNYSVELTATSDRGCAKTLSKLVAIGSSPLADFAVGPSCLNKPTAFNDISSGGVLSRIWQIASSSFAFPNPTYTFTMPGDFAATLTVTGSGGCSSMVSKTISVPVAPSLAFTTSNPCATQAASFSDATSSPADLVIGWNWNADGNSITGNPAEHIFPSSGVFNVKMTTTHASGCAYLLSNNISIHPSPTAAFIPLPDRGAAPLTVQFENASLGATQYQWIFKDKIQSTSTDASPVYTFIDLGDYSAELTAVNSFGCKDILSVPISVLIPSIDLAITDFSLTTDPVTGNLKSIVTILNNSNIPLENAEIALHLSDNAVVNETLVLNLSPGQSSTQMLSFTISPTQVDLNFVCAAVLSEKDIQPDNNKRCLSIEEGDYVFAPYPNPSSGVLQIDWISEAVGSARITVYNSMGKREYEWETPSAAGLNQSVHNLAFLSTGMYYVTIQTATSVQTMRFLRL